MNNNIKSQRLTPYRAVIPFCILYDLDLNANHLRLYGQIEQMESHPDSKVSPTFSYSWLGKQCGMNRRNAMKMAKVLVEKGYIERKEIEQGIYVWNTKKTEFRLQEGSVSDRPWCHTETLPGVTQRHPPGVTQRHPNIPEDNIPKYKYINPIGDSANTPCEVEENFSDYSAAEPHVHESASAVIPTTADTQTPGNYSTDAIMSDESYWKDLEDAFNQRYGTPAVESTTPSASDNIAAYSRASSPAINSPKSDYCKNQIDNQTLDTPDKKKPTPYSIKNIQEDNIFSIPEQALVDWLENRKKQRLPLTKTAWKDVNNELTRCKEQGIDPIYAFEKMVGGGWKSFNVEYFQKQRKTQQSWQTAPTQHRWDVDSVMRA